MIETYLSSLSGYLNLRNYYVVIAKNLLHIIKRKTSFAKLLKLGHKWEIYFKKLKGIAMRMSPVVWW